MRTEIIFKLVCSECGETLEAYTGDNTKTAAHNAFNAEAQISIKPCQNCYYNARKPILLLRQVIDLIEQEDSDGK